MPSTTHPRAGRREWLAQEWQRDFPQVQTLRHELAELEQAQPGPQAAMRALQSAPGSQMPGEPVHAGQRQPGAA